MLTIGEFSRITHLSVRSLRRYHDGGLLLPATVDPVSGYRYYALDQVATAQVIHRFRQLDMPVADLRALLTTEDAARRAALMADHLARLEAQLDRTRAAVATLRLLLGEQGEAPEVVVRRLPAAEVAGVRAEVDHDDVLRWFGEAAARLARAVPGRSPSGGRYDHTLFTDGRGAALVFVETPHPPTGRGVERLTLPERRVATLVHVGDHDTIDVSYARLGTEVAARGIGAEGPVEEHYLVGPSDTAEAAAWRTELAWPVS